MTNLFFISSPLHFLIACNLASERADAKNIAVIISKNAESARIFEKTVASGLTDFATSKLLLEKKGAKLSSRKALFHEIEQLVNSEQPTSIFTGNDRRIEFQYAMHSARKINPATNGVYMDDGAVSYLGHKSINSVFHRYIDPFLKKIVYGSWWNNALTTGASNWVSCCYLAFPDLAHPLLTSKSLKPINPDGFVSEAFSKIGSTLLEGQLTSTDLADSKALFCLPVDDEFLENKSLFLRTWEQLKKELRAEEIAIKAHPRSKLDSAIAALFPGSVILPKSVGFEALLPLLNKQTKIMGTASTSLLTARWLRPEIEVYSLTKSSSPKLTELFEAVNVKSLNAQS